MKLTPACNMSKVCHAIHGVENWTDADHVQTLKFANTHAVSLRNCKDQVCTSMWRRQIVKEKLNMLNRA